MITIGYSTIKEDKNFTEYLKKSCGIPSCEVIPFENPGTHSLTEAYNILLKKASNDIVVLCHDDIYFEKNNWGNKILKHFKRNPEYGILGVAGSTQLPASCRWWEDPSTMRGIVNHEHEGKKWESKYSQSIGNKIDQTILVDGLFIAINKNVITKNFDESVNGFHFYDVDFCVRNTLDDVKIGVLYDIRITHKSIGMTNESWENNRKILTEKYSESLPLKIKYTSESSIKTLVLINDNTEIDEIMSLSSSNTIIIGENLNSNNIKTLKKKGFNCYTNKTVPGFFIGDGKTKMNFNGNQIITTPGKYYRVSPPLFDYCLSYSDDLLSAFKTLYPKVPKTRISEEIKTQHNSIVETLPKTNDIDLNEKIVSNLNNFIQPNDTVKIISGYSEKGGSTTAFINLTNYFNENGINCTFYGPHNWHLNKCKSDTLDNLKFEKSDKVIAHFIDLPQRPDVDTIVLSSHEKWWFKVGDKKQFWDKVIFLHNEHQKYHKEYKGEFEIIPNLKENLVKKDKTNLDKVAGVIGTIEDRKQTHISIQRALSDGCEKVLLFGHIGDSNYYDTHVKSLVDNQKVVHYGHSTNKQEMYDQIGRVYHSSKGEVACLVKDECHITNTKFFGNEETNHEVSDLSNQDIINEWKKILKI